MLLVRDKLFSIVGLSHFAVDVLNGQRSVLFVYLAVALGLSNTQLGFFSTAYILIAALLQPLFGLFADRFGGRWAIAGGTFWIGAFFTLGLLTPGLPALAFFVLASLGSGAFHPAGTMQATLVGRARYAGRETTASSYFFLFGQTGLFVGPLLGGFMLQRGGPPVLLWLSGFAMLVGFIGFARLGRSAILLHEHLEIQPAAAPARRTTGFWLLFAALATTQSWVQQNMLVFLPKFLSDSGQNAAVYGLLSSLFIGASAMGLLVGGALADRFGKRRVAAAMLTVAVLPLTAIPLVGFSPWLYLLIPLAGLFAGSTHTIVVVLAQRYIPGGMAMTSGLILGFIFASGALGVLLSGYIADAFGVVSIFWLTAGLAFLAAILALSLRRNTPPEE
jgi:FSR family fosmidomycin resistance protein-like MFS transporter